MNDNTDTLINDMSRLTLPVNGNGRNGQLVAETDFTPPLGAEPVFESPAMKEIVATVKQVAPSTASILLTGETGVGKEVIADLIHENSRPGKPIVRINCAALPGELIESELFGSVKGSFTGSLTNRDGLFKEAGDGTILLDEISEMPLDTQAKLLRVLQERKIRPVGGQAFFPIHCRVITSTNRLPEEAIRDGKLRQDLFYRISAFGIHIPPLRERLEDIIPLARAFLKGFARENGRPALVLTEPAESFLLARGWPGNVRELQNVIERGVLLSDNALDVGDFLPKYNNQPPESSSAAKLARLDLTLMENMELVAIALVLRECGGNKKATAEKLGIGRQTIYNKIKLYGLGEFVASLG